MLKFLPVFLTSITLFSCATTKIQSQDPYADIYMDNKWIGTGETSIGSIGPPRTATLEAKRGKRTVGRTSMRRRFTFKTILLGAISYYTGLYWGWYFPKEVIIKNNQQAEPSTKSISQWDNPRESIWMQPMQAK